MCLSILNNEEYIRLTFIASLSHTIPLCLPIPPLNHMVARVRFERTDGVISAVAPLAEGCFKPNSATSPDIWSEGGDSNSHGSSPSVFKTDMSRLIPSPSDNFQDTLKGFEPFKICFFRTYLLTITKKFAVSVFFINN